MPIFAALLQLALVALPSMFHTVENFNGAVNPGGYIVMVKDGIALSRVIRSISSRSTITYQYNIINGFACNLAGNDVDNLRANRDVALISEDVIVTTAAIQLNATWGLGRLSSDNKLVNQNDRALTFEYGYDDYDGSGVDVYVVDTGIYTAHPEFGGRATWGATFGPYADADGNGHGTHVAGTIAANTFGVAKLVNVIAVKVLSDQGPGTLSDVIAGLDWVASQASSTGNPTVINMSLIVRGGAIPLDAAVVSLTNAGIHVVVGAGNNSEDAGNASPARVPSAITVGASDITDTMAYFSNFGSVLDVFAPGLNVISTWYDGTIRLSSGTSMASPHVAGLAAYIISIYGNTSPATLQYTIKVLAHSGILAGVPPGTANLLINNGFRQFQPLR